MMLRTRLFYLGLGVLLLTASPAWSQSEPLLDEPSDFGLRSGLGGDGPDRPDCRLITLARGPLSGFGFNDPAFTGADLVIRNPEQWLTFWNEHVALLDPQPPAPDVDFRRHAVIAVVQGRQTSGGGPNIAVLQLVAYGHRVIVFDDERPGPLDVITNPFHIVLVDRRCLRPDPQFEHIAPRPGSAVLMGHVAGMLPEQDPRPLPGARVSLRAADASRPPRVAYTGLDGSYFFVNVPPGAYAARAEKPGFEPEQEPVVLPEDGRVHKDFLLNALPPPPPGRIFGHVARPAEGGPEPLAGATITLARPDGPLAATQSGPDGAYEFPQVPPGAYVLRVTKEGFQPALVPVAVPPGGEVERDFVLRPVETPTIGRLVGLVQTAGPEGALVPVRGARVRVLLPGGHFRESTTNMQGRYAIWGLPAGSFTARASKPGFAPAEAEVTIVAGETTAQDFVLTAAPGRAVQPSGANDETMLAAPSTPR